MLGVRQEGLRRIGKYRPRSTPNPVIQVVHCREFGGCGLRSQRLFLPDTQEFVLRRMPGVDPLDYCPPCRAKHRRVLETDEDGIRYTLSEQDALARRGRAAAEGGGDGPGGHPDALGDSLPDMFRPA